jgi:hypothetical protein
MLRYFWTCFLCHRLFGLDDYGSFVVIYMSVLLIEDVSICAFFIEYCFFLNYFPNNIQIYLLHQASEWNVVFLICIYRGCGTLSFHENNGRSGA